MDKIGRIFPILKGPLVPRYLIEASLYGVKTRMELLVHVEEGIEPKLLGIGILFTCGWFLQLFFSLSSYFIRGRIKMVYSPEKLKSPRSVFLGSVSKVPYNVYVWKVWSRSVPNFLRYRGTTETHFIKMDILRDRQKREWISSSFAVVPLSWLGIVFGVFNDCLHLFLWLLWPLILCFLSSCQLLVFLLCWVSTFETHCYKPWSCVFLSEAVKQGK